MQRFYLDYAFNVPKKIHFGMADIQIKLSHVVGEIVLNSKWCIVLFLFQQCAMPLYIQSGVFFLYLFTYPVDKPRNPANETRNKFP